MRVVFRGLRAPDRVLERQDLPAVVHLPGLHLHVHSRTRQQAVRTRRGSGGTGMRKRSCVRESARAMGRGRWLCFASERRRRRRRQRPDAAWESSSATRLPSDSAGFARGIDPAKRWATTLRAPAPRQMQHVNKEILA
eukprot:3732984-Rhodomonas_salina.1